MFLDKKSYGAFVVDESVNLDDAQLECAVDVERAWGEMMLECCAMEFKAYQESGDVNAVNEGVIESIKNWFKKVWDAIKRFFGKAVAAIRSKTMSCKEFYDKYKKDIQAGLAKVKDFKGFKYDLAGFDALKVAQAVSANDKLAAYLDLEEKKDADATKAIIKAIADAAGFETAETNEDLMKNAQKKWQGGATDKTTLETADINAAVASIKSDVQVKNTALAMKMSENLIKDMEAQAEKTYKENKDDLAEQSRVKSRMIGFFRTIVSTTTSLQTKYVKMLHAEADQAMAIMRAAISASKKKDESVDFSTNEAMDYLRSQGIEF